MKRLTLLLALVLSSCATPAPVPTATRVPTLVISTVPASPTETLAPTAIPTATATEAPAEIDLKPHYEQNVSVEYMGVKIDASLITDESLDPTITKVTVGDRAYAEFIARSIYKVWLKKGGPDGTGPAAATTFEEFMKLWSAAQQSGKEEDWRQVQIKNIWANDIPTPGYVQQPYTIWFMHEGQTPEDVRGISRISVALVKTSKMENITAFANNEDDMGMGTNFEDEHLYFYVGLDNSFYSAGKTASMMAFSGWLIRNSGGPISGYPNIGDDSLKAILLHGSLTQQ